MDENLNIFIDEVILHQLGFFKIKYCDIENLSKNSPKKKKKSEFATRGFWFIHSLLAV
jgi:hypothetical protein